jgi:T5SS/PEP-CTERM-associated repeat protein
VVTGSGSKLDVGSSLTIGGSGTGTLEVHSGGVVPVFGGVTVSGASTLDLTTGASMETSVGQSIANNGLIRASSSQIRSDIVNAGTLNLLAASVTRSVTLQANSQMTADNSTVGSLTQQSTAGLKFTLRSAADFDNLAVAGSASLGGDIVVSLMGGFAPSLGTEFQILTASSISGAPTFDFASAPLASGLAWLIVQVPTSVSLQIVPAGIAGDYNGDASVNAADYVLWRKHNNTAVTLPNDATPGTSAADYSVWRSHFGQSQESGSGAIFNSAVPEPAAIMLVMFGVASWCLRRSRAMW